MRNTSGLKRTAGPGRPRGSRNKVTVEILEFWRDFFASAEYRQSAIRRLLSGKAPHVEAYWLRRLHGEKTEVEVNGTVDLSFSATYASLKRPDAGV